MATRKAATRKRSKKPAKKAKEPAKKPAKRSSLYRRKSGETNRQRLITAGVINPDYVFSPSDTAAIETLSNQEVNVLIQVFVDLGEPFFENNSPNGFVF